LIYPYLCPKCEHAFDVIKSVADMDREEPCLKCEAPAERQFTARVHFIGAKVTHAEYNPGLGCVVKNKSHKDDLLKAKGLVEVGNEKPETLHREAERTNSEIRESRWTQALKEIE
jgi:putative FmdB family regulatory protein